MEQLLADLVQTAREDRVVMIHKLPEGLQLVVYPLENAVLLGFGFGKDVVPPVAIETVLRRRADDPARFGAWMPVMFNDDTWHVVRRFDNDGSASGVSITENELFAVEELLG